MPRDQLERRPIIGGILFVIGFLVGFLITFAALNVKLEDSEDFCGLAKCGTIVDLLSFFGEAALSMLPWPLVVLLIFFSIGPDRISNLFRKMIDRVRRVRLGDTEIELTAEGKAAIELDAMRFKAEVQTYRQAVVLKSLQLTRRYKIREKLNKIFPEERASSEWESFPIQPLHNWRENVRVTIHVPDFVFADRLVQLVDYVGDGAAGTAGRTFSTRQGIIGKVWRGEVAILENNLITGSVDDPNTIKRIIQNWGMTADEAHNAKKYPSYFAMPIHDRFESSPDARSASEVIGVLYLDCRNSDLFKNKNGIAVSSENNESEKVAKDLEDWIAKRIEAVGIRAAIIDIREAMREYDPDITLAV